MKMKMYKISMNCHNLKRNSHGYDIDMSMYNIDYISEIYKFTPNFYMVGTRYLYNNVEKELSIFTDVDIEKIQINYYSAIEDRNNKIDKLLKH